MTVVPFPGERAPRLDAVFAALDDGLREGVAPGLSAVVLSGGEAVHASVHGDARLEPTVEPLTRAHLFDVASLTKVMATTTLAAALLQDRAISLDDRVTRYLPAFGRNGKGEVTLRHLLAHSSGLPAWREIYLEVAKDPTGRAAFLPPGERPPFAELRSAFVRGLAMVKEAVLSERLEAPPGARAVYSDIGFIALGLALEVAAGEALDRLFEKRVATPLGLEDTFFVNPREVERAERRRAERFVATERCVHRGEVNQGTVNDDNAYAMGGVAAHAGLFSTANDVARFGQAWLDALHGRRSLLRPEVAALFATRDATPGSTRALGWDTPSEQGSSFGTKLGRGRAIGHLGFTGCSLWIDVDREIVCALLTNRVHPSRDNEKIRAFRPLFHDAVAEALG